MGGEAQPRPERGDDREDQEAALPRNQFEGVNKHQPSAVTAVIRQQGIYHLAKIERVTVSVILSNFTDYSSSFLENHRKPVPFRQASQKPDLACSFLFPSFMKAGILALGQKWLLWMLLIHNLLTIIFYGLVGRIECAGPPNCQRR